ncbi:MAG: flagellar basal body rod protein FlgC [Cyanobacteria bacterium]|nr:flagellar basal body rod protein FlgC [Cyanobacteriota bacterium]
MDIYDITASAMTAQRLRLDVISSNLANANTTRKADGTIGAYHRKNVVFAPIYGAAQGGGNFGETHGSGKELELKEGDANLSMGTDGKRLLKGRISQAAFNGAGVEVQQIADDDKTPTRLVYDPSHPDANEKGYVEMPNVNVVTEMVDMISASRAYEANVTALQSGKAMAQAALEI